MLKFGMTSLFPGETELMLSTDISVDLNPQIVPGTASDVLGILSAVAVCVKVRSVLNAELMEDTVKEDIPAAAEYATLIPTHV
jgi:hypothetical protein